MSKVKIYGLRSHLEPIRAVLSDTIHSCVVDALHYPIDKRAHRYYGNNLRNSSRQPPTPQD
jgi:hypothetical protein